ncbi:D-2-hydroxyacid dehydrogenase [uncultured Roseobacter sp.]|uniref:D-2-hydroxyacid dehydrogenase n=1 Tax=uncultured Roseobacter sp. TaxID=114847 RepID=UPI0026325E26|nr:D-2-hydroxyacid dehydrogenase [uncultured Roseobacter sp.]
MSSAPVVILHTDNPDPALQIATAAHPDLEIHTCDSYAALPQMIADTAAEVIYSVRFAGTPGFPRDDTVNSATVRWLSVGGSGTDHLGRWDSKRLTVTNAAGVAADMMAEYTLGAMLHFSLDLPGFRRAQKERHWSAGKVEPIAGKTILIVGLGKTGQAIAQRCKALELTVLGVRARPAPLDHVDVVQGMADLPDLWPQADFIAVCVPLLDSTRGMIDATAIKMMKRNAVLIDVSRGGVVDQKALAQTLQKNALKGAALDVFETEPLPEDSPFWEMPNVIVTPHCASVYDGWDLKSVRMFCDNLTRYRRGRPLLNIVDPMRGY